MEGLTVEFPAGDGYYTVINDVHFNVFPKEVVALVGESGSGKSVTAKAITKLLPEHLQINLSGSVWLRKASGAALDLITASNHEMEEVRGRDIAIVFQESLSGLNPALTCGSQIIEVLQMHLKLGYREALARSIELLEDVGIAKEESIHERYPHQLSGGQVQRVFIAMAIASQPRLLIADEPTTALDATSRKRVMQVLKKVKEKYGLAILFITHDLELATEIADRVLVMHTGLMVEQGITEAVFNKAKHPYTKGLVNCRPPKDKRLYFLPTLDDFMRVTADGTDLEDSPELDQVTNSLILHPQYRKLRHETIYDGQPIMKVSHCSKNFTSRNAWFGKRTKHAVNDVSFEVYQGETLGILGSSGCGKTTLAKCITGLMDPDQGEVLFLDDASGQYKPMRSPRAIGERVQYIFQDPYASLNPRLTIKEILLEPLQSHRPDLKDHERSSRLLELIAKVGLKPHHLERYPKAFSGGQRQRICIARALLMDPKIIICDEAVASLDVSVQAQVLNLLNELKYEYNLSYIFISHDANVVRFMSDRIGILKDGKLLELQEADTLFESPQHAYTESLIA